MGKWEYMSPEIASDKEPFDGHAADLFAVGAILFILVVGNVGWDQPYLTDETFMYLSGGYLQRILGPGGWDVGLSTECCDLLQKMIFYSPGQRLSLAQITAHPWMRGEVRAPREEDPRPWSS